MRALLTALLALQLLTAAGLAWLIHARRGDEALASAHQARAAAHARAGAEHAAAHRYVEAQLAYERATRLAGALLEAEAWLDAARRSLALAAVQRPDAPGPLERRALAGIAAALRGAGDLAVADALEIALLRGEGLIPAALARAEAAHAAHPTDPASPWIRWQYATLLLHAGRAADATGHLEALVNQIPDFSDGFHRLGLAYLAADRHEAGVSALQRAVEKGAGPAASRDLARAFLGRQLWAEAQAPLETVLRADPGDAEALRLLAASQYQLKRFRPAAETYRKAYRLAPEPRTLISAVIALQGAEAWAEALGVIEELLPQASRLPEIRFHQAVLNERLARPQAARAAYSAYLELAAGHPDEGPRVESAKARLAALPE